MYRTLASLTIVSLLLQSCALTVETFTKEEDPLIAEYINQAEKEFNRGPASSETFADVIKKFQGFRILLLGTEQEGNCSKAQLDADFNKMMSSLKKNSCSETTFELDREAFNKKQCPSKKTPGYLEGVVKQRMLAEKNKKPITSIMTDPSFPKYMKAATSYFKALQIYLTSPKYSKDDKVALLSAYVENILLPVRDTVIALKAYEPTNTTLDIFYTATRPVLSNALYAALDSGDRDLLTQGSNPIGDPIYLMFQKHKDGYYLLTYAPNEIVRRDVLTLLKAPTAKNYVTALKWMTLHMMVSQMYLYNTLLGKKEAITIPNSCQNFFNGNMPSKMNFKYEDGLGDEFLENILKGHGLSYNEDDISYFDYYVDNVNKDPTKDGYSGLVPFENFKMAQMGYDKNRHAALNANFDDIAHFKTILDTKLPEVSAIFQGKMKGQTIKYAGHDIFNKILGDFTADEVANIPVGKESVEIYPGKQNLSHYLLEVMQDNGVSDYQDLITPRMKKKFVGRHAYVFFPSLYSAPAWRDWSLRYLADALEKNKNVAGSSSLYKDVMMACVKHFNESSPFRYLCKQHTVANVANLLSEFRTGETYIPTRRLEERKFGQLYPFLSDVWTSFRDKHNLLPEAKPFELNFLLDQMAAGNPWARLKMSYMVALDRLEAKMEKDEIKYAYSYPAYNVYSPGVCSAANLKAQYQNLIAAGKVLGLDQTLSYDHATRNLKYAERTKIWNAVKDDVNERNAQLFTTKVGSTSYYKYIENISYKTILNAQDAVKYGGGLSAQAKNEISKVSGQADSELARFFLTLYKTKDRAQQEKLYQQFAEKNGVDSTFSLKLNFLAVDEAYKKPIYKDLLKNAAAARKNQISQQINRFCNLRVNDENQFKEIFYSATKAQNELNQLAGLPSVPKEALDTINSMTSSEWRDLWLGIGSGVAGLAAIVIGGACTTLSGGICAPLGGVMAAAGVSSIAMQVKLTSNELDRKRQSDATSSRIKVLEDLGFADTGSHEEIERSYAWAAFEAISIFPLIGVATRSVSLGPKLVLASSKSMLRQSGKVAFKSKARKALQEEEVKVAHYLLGLSNMSKNAGVDAKAIKNAQMKIGKIKDLYARGDISMSEMAKRIMTVLDPIKKAKIAASKTARAELGKIHVKESKAQIDAQTAKLITQYFGDNPREMLRTVQGYTGDRLQRAIGVMDEIDTVDRINKRGVFGGMKDWYLRMRNETLAQNASKLLKLEKDLAAMGTSRGKMQAYVQNNIENITDIFIEIPMKKREVPYFVLVQGSPHMSFMKNQKLPIVGMLSEGQILKKVVTARARLVHESYKAQARLTLKLPKYVNSETGYDVFKAFQDSVVEMINKNAKKDTKALMKEYRDFEDAVAKQLYDKYPGQSKVPYADFKSMVLTPKNLQQKATAEAIWESVPADELYKMPAMGKYAHKVAEQLSNYSDIDSFERYLSALRVLTVNKNAAVLEIF